MTKYIGVARIFGWVEDAKPLITRNHVVKIFRKVFLLDKDTPEWRIKSWGLGRHATWVFLKKKDLNLKLKRCPNFSKLGDVVSKLVQSKRITDGGLGAAAGRFFGIFFEKNSYFNAIWTTFCTFLVTFKITTFLRSENQLKQSNWLVFP